MNYLAHIYLSGTQEKIILGNFIGDFIKGNQGEQFDQQIRNGIALHREIDRFTDDHLIVLESKKRLWGKYHHYAAVIIDVFYDHFLASHWHRYHSTPLSDFTRQFYQIINKYQSIIPKRAQRMFFYMQQDNWLYHYQSLEGIRATLTGISKRTKFSSGLENAHHDLKTHYNQFGNEFEMFFPDLKQHATDFLSSLNT